MGIEYSAYRPSIAGRWLGVYLLILFSPVVVGSSDGEYTPQAPLYSSLYEQLLHLERQGRAEQALRLIPAIYAAEIPVDAFYDRLEEARQRLITTVLEQEPMPGARTVCRDVLPGYVRFYLSKPATYRFLVPGSGELDFPEINLIELVPAGTNGVVVRRWAGDRNQARRWTAVSDRKVDLSQMEYRAIAVRPGSYRLVFNSVTGNPGSGFYGAGTVIAADKGRLVVAPIPVLPAI